MGNGVRETKKNGKKEIKMKMVVKRKTERGRR